MTVAQPSACLRFVQRICRGFQAQSGHDATVLSHLRIHSSQPGTIRGTFPIHKHNLNRLGTLHGGCLATLTDTLGSLAVASHGFYSTGVSTDLHTTYVRSAGGVGDSVLVSAQVVGIGKTLAFTRVEFRQPDSDLLVAYGSHTKFIARALKHPENVRFSGDGSEVVEGKQPDQWAED